MAARLEAHTEELLSVAAALAAAARTLGGLPPLTHPPLAADEVSVSAAGRLTAHGGVLASRASDATAVLASAAQALGEAVRAYTDMDAANAGVVSLGGRLVAPAAGFGEPAAVFGGPAEGFGGRAAVFGGRAAVFGGRAAGLAGPAMMPSVTADAPVPEVPISPPVPRDGEVSAALMEAGDPHAGTGFVSGCGAYASAFRGGAAAVRGAQASVAGALQGQAGPRIGAALGRFADWADAMGQHAEALGGLASGHRARFLTARHDTPSTRDFETTRQELATADELNFRTRGAYSGVVAGLQNRLAGLHTRAGAAAENFYTGEAGAAADSPPRVETIVTGAQGDPVAGSSGSSVSAGSSGSSVSAGSLGSAGSAGSSGPAGSVASVASALPMMAAELPSMLAGALGGVVGMAAAIPEQIGEQVQSLASEAVQGVSGLASGLGKPDGDSSAAQHLPSDGEAGSGGDGVGADAGGGGADGGAGVTDPAAGAPLPPSSDSEMVAAGTDPAPTPLVGQAGSAAGVPAADAGPGGVPMMAPGMSMGAGAAGGARPVSMPDKTIHLPAEPNSVPVKGDIVRRATAVSDDPTAKPVPAVAVSSQRRRIVVPKDDGGD